MVTTPAAVAADPQAASATARCGACGAAFPAVLTGGRCPQCREQLPESEFSTTDDGPVLRWWYANLKNRLFLVLVVATVALIQAIILAILVFNTN